MLDWRTQFSKSLLIFHKSFLLLFSLFYIILSFMSLFHSSISSSMMFIHQAYFKSCLLYSLSVIDSFYTFFICMVRVSLMFAILFSRQVRILMIVALNSPSGMLLISASLRSLVLALSCTLIWVKFLHLGICLSLCLLCVERSFIPPALQSDGFMKKRSCHVHRLVFREFLPCMLLVFCCRVLAVLSSRPVVCRGFPCLLWVMCVPWPACGKF